MLIVVKQKDNKYMCGVISLYSWLLHAVVSAFHICKQGSRSVT